VGSLKSYLHIYCLGSYVEIIGIKHFSIWVYDIFFIRLGFQGYRCESGMPIFFSFFNGGLLEMSSTVRLIMRVQQNSERFIE